MARQNRGGTREERREAVFASAAMLKLELDAFLATLAADGIDLDDLLAGKPYAARYKGDNPARILMQDPDATDVRGPLDWLDAGRSVRRYPEGQYGITIVQPLGNDRDKDKDAAQAQADADADAAPKGKQPGEISSDDLKPKRMPFTLTTVHDVRNTDPVVCETCGAAIHRTGMETAEQVKARGGRRRASLWTHTETKPADGHKAVRLWVDPAAAASPAA
jgi:hypothetical protein